MSIVLLYSPQIQIILKIICERGASVDSSVNPRYRRFKESFVQRPFMRLFLSQELVSDGLLGSSALLRFLHFLFKLSISL